MIVKEDVLQVAKSLNMQPTDEQVEAVLAIYKGEAKQDPSATWDLVVEHCLNQVGVE